MEEKKFLDEVLGHIPRATWWEKREIRAELAGHLEDHALDLEERGCSTEEAREQAVAAMGDPGEIGEALNAQLSDFWLTIQGLAQIGAAILLVLMFLTGWERWENLEIRIHDNKLVRPEMAWRDFARDPRVTWKQNRMEKMMVGDSVVRLEGIDIKPDLSTDEAYWCSVTFRTYREQTWKIARDEIFYHIQVIPEGGEAAEATRPDGPSPSNGGCSGGTYNVLIPIDATYVDVVYDYLGEHVEMRCPIEWEEIAWDGEES